MMATEDPMKMPAAAAAAAASGGGELEDLEAMLLENHQHQHQHRSRAAAAAAERERELNIFRSGSAPPTVEGSRNAVGSLFGNPDVFVGLHGAANSNSDVGGVLSEEEMRSHPAYLSYYYSNENLNPRLPPPAISKEDWRVAQRFRPGTSSFGGIGDRRDKAAVVNGSGGGNGSSRSLFSLQPGILSCGVDGNMALGTQKNLAQQPLAEWFEQGTDGLIGLGAVGMGAKRKSFADALQEDLGRSASLSGHLSRPLSHSTFDNIGDSMDAVDAHLRQLQNDIETVDSLHPGANSPSPVRVQSLGSPASLSFGSVIGSSLARSATPDFQLIGRSSSPCLPPIGGRSEIPSNGVSSCMTEDSDIVTALSGLNLTKNRLVDQENHAQDLSFNEFANHPLYPFNMANDRNNYLQQKNINNADIDSLNISSFPMLAYNEVSKKNGITNINVPKLATNGQANLPNWSSAAGIYSKVQTGSTISEVAGNPCQSSSLMNVDYTGNNINGFSANQRLPTLMNSQLEGGVNLAGSLEGQYLHRNGNHVGSGLQVPLMDPGYAQYLQRTDSAAQVATSLSDPSVRRNLLGSSYMDSSGYQKAYLGALLAQQKLQYGMPFLGKSGTSGQEYYGNPAFGIGMSYPTSPISNFSLSSLGSGIPLRQGDRLSRFPSMVRSSAGGSWNSDNGAIEEGFASSLLGEFKSNKTRSFELSEIVDHVFEFSVDQYGSRFIQQKLEIASVNEKNKIFPGILLHARALMTDVFGNYVIQKFFEHGTESQRKQLASQLTGHVLPLSLQMYGCRVIQKALEVVDVDQQTQMVLELDGSIMKCVRDQNGNHVIQKCIECVPQERIQFIISSFYGQVVALSTHPYGCRVIQRVLEHCDDAETQSIMMEEIMQSVSTLAQDQYGNYVVQHVLQHGQPEERTAIISKLSGQIVKMSQQKFASNVVEKCLTYGTPEERQLLIDEMLGSTDENEPLQAMMKDQFANYVVQKVLETCDDQNRELILSRIKVHLNALKRYTYGKHIVARVEKLIAAGERRIGMSSYSS